MICVTVYEDINDVLSVGRKTWWKKQNRNKNDKIPRARETAKHQALGVKIEKFLPLVVRKAKRKEWKDINH